MNFTKIFALTLFAPLTAAAVFSDTAGHPFESSILFVQRAAIVSGYSDGTFRPDATINRAEFSKIIVASNHTVAEIASCAYDTVRFSDVPTDAWFSQYVCMALKAGYVSGYSDGTFRPANTINIAEASKILAIAYDLRLPQYFMETEWYRPYFDALIGAYAMPQPEPAVSSLLSRGQMAFMIHSLEDGASPQQKKCEPRGCSGTVCADEDVITTCELKESDACYAQSVCERQQNGECGWTATPEYVSCINALMPKVGYLDYFDGALDEDRDIVLFFYADWCPFCRKNDELLRSEAIMYIPIYKTNFDIENSLRSRFGITTQDTFVHIDANGDVVTKLVSPSESELRLFIESFTPVAPF